MKSLKETLYGDCMLLRDLINDLNIDYIALQPLANEINVSDAYSNNPEIEVTETQIKIYCNDGNATRVLCVDFDKQTIADLFLLENRTGGTVYSFDGFILQTI